MSALPTAQMGKDGPRVPRMGFGLMGLSVAYGKVESDEERFKVLDRAHELGATHWDSSDVYLDSEDLVGKWFARTGKRDDIFLATKFGITFNPDGSFGANGDPAYVRECCEKSLKRLGVSQIDLFYCHRYDGPHSPPLPSPWEGSCPPRASRSTLTGGRQDGWRNADREDGGGHGAAQTVRAGDDALGPVPFAVAAVTGPSRLRRARCSEGKIKYLGLSEVSAATLRRAHAVHPITAVQLEYSPFAMEIEDPQIGLRETCRELGIAVVAYSPLGRGLLTGQLKSPDDFEEGDFRKWVPRYSAENFPKNLKLVDQLGVFAQKKGCTTGQLTLAWLLAQGPDIFPIPGTKKIKYLEENTAAVHIKLTSEETAEIRKAIEATEVHGDRYPAQCVFALLFPFYLFPPATLSTPFHENDGSWSWALTAIAG